MKSDRLVKMIGTFFYVGHLPWAPGTWGSLAGLLIAWFSPEPSRTLLLVFMCIAGFYACPRAVAAYQAKDPSVFVMDEVCGMMLGILWLPRSVWVALVGFLLFRFFDVVKPWPISWIQKKDHPSCILWDDLLAGAFTNAVLRAGLLLGAPALFARLDF